MYPRNTILLLLVKSHWPGTDCARLRLVKLTLHEIVSTCPELFSNGLAVTAVFLMTRWLSNFGLLSFCMVQPSFLLGSCIIARIQLICIIVLLLLL